MSRKTRKAQRAYFAAGNKAGAVLDRLDSRKARSRTERAWLLSELALCESEMADHQMPGWPKADDAAEVTEGHRNSADILHMLASTEAAEGAYARTKGPAGWEDVFDHILDDLTGETDIGRRAELCTRLYLAAHPVIGSGAAETIARIGNSYTRIALAQQTQDASGSVQITDPTTA